MVERLKALCNKKKTTFSSVEKELGFSNGSLIKSKPDKISAYRVKALANYFGVSMDYLLTGDVHPTYSPEIRDFITRLEKLPREYQNDVFKALKHAEYDYAESLNKKDSSLA